MYLRSNRKRSIKVRERILSVREVHEQKTVQQRGRKRVHQACARTLEPTQQKERRLEKKAEYEAAKRLGETSEQNKDRLEKKAEYEAAKRLGETSEQNKDRQGAKKRRS